MTIDSIAQSISKILDKARPALALLPPFLMMCGALRRPGLSDIAVTANIIQRQSEAGAPTGALADGSRNVAEGMERVRVEEIFKALRMDARVEVVVPPGAISFMGFGANAGGPVTVQGTNMTAVNLLGFIR